MKERFYTRNNPNHSYEYVINAINSLTDSQFDKMNQAEYDYWDFTGIERNKAYKRLRYWCDKIHITLNDWWAWCDC